jgi:hypothetical protein
MATISSIDMFWTTLRKNSLSLQNGVAMEALTTANTSNGHWKMLVTVILFITPVISLPLYSTIASRDKIILWLNPRPFSARSCRPVRIQLKQQGNELAKEASVVEERIMKLEKTVLNVQEQKCHICE